MDWERSGESGKRECEPVSPLQWWAMELPWRLLAIACHLINNLSANVINVEDKALEIEIPSGYMLVYEDQALQEGVPQNQPELTDSVFANRDQEHFQESLDQLHSPPKPPTLTLGDPQHQRGGAPHPLASRPRWDEPGGFGGEYAWSGEDLQRIGGGQREPQRRVGLNLEPVLAPKNFTVAGQEVKHHKAYFYQHCLVFQQNNWSEYINYIVKLRDIVCQLQLVSSFFCKFVTK